MRRWALFLTAVLPGLCAVMVCGYYLFQDWSALITAFARFERLVQEGADTRRLMVAQSLDQVYRINCFADGVGVMLGAVILAIGMHGLCTMPRPENAPNWKRNVTEAVLASVITCAALVFFGALAERVGQTNTLRRAVVRGDVKGVERAFSTGARGGDRFWWGVSARDVAATGPTTERGHQIQRRLAGMRATESR